MRVPAAGAVLVLTFLATAGSLAAEEPHFGYHGATGPSHWGELSPEWATCADGARQSPVALAGATHRHLARLSFDYRPSKATVTDTGHTLNFAPSARDRLRLGATSAGVLQQLHFHAASEHTLGGRSYPVELHFVHAGGDGRLTVVGVFVRQGAANAALGTLLRRLPAAEGASVTGSIDPGALIPVRHGSIRYRGSLTTPPCSEGVRWIVLTTPITASRAQIARLRDRYAGNHRPLQPLRGRTLLTDG